MTDDALGTAVTQFDLVQIDVSLPRHEHRLTECSLETVTTVPMLRDCLDQWRGPWQHEAVVMMVKKCRSIISCGDTCIFTDSACILHRTTLACTACTASRTLLQPRRIWIYSWLKCRLVKPNSAFIAEIRFPKHGERQADQELLRLVQHPSFTHRFGSGQPAEKVRT